VLYNETTHKTLLGIYIFDIIKLSKDIYIEIRDWAERDNLQITIDAKRIISNLDMPLENVKWKALQNVKGGALINEIYDNIIDSVGFFTDSATRILKSKTPEDVWEGYKFKRDILDYYYVSYSEEFEPFILSRAAFEDKYIPRYELRPDSTRCKTVSFNSI